MPQPWGLGVRRESPSSKLLFAFFFFFHLEATMGAKGSGFMERVLL